MSRTNRIVERIEGRSFADNVMVEYAIKKASLPFRESFCERMFDELVPKEPRPKPGDKPLGYLQEVVMPFGEYKGFAMSEVPLDYLEWLCRANEDFYKHLRAYLRHPDTRRQMDAEGVGQD